jgi:hypothetical protein
MTEMTYNDELPVGEEAAEQESRHSTYEQNARLYPSPTTRTASTEPNMDVQAALNPATLFNAKGLVVAITGGGSGTYLVVSELPHYPTLTYEVGGIS